LIKIVTTPCAGGMTWATCRNRPATSFSYIDKTKDQGAPHLIWTTILCVRLLAGPAGRREIDPRTCHVTMRAARSRPSARVRRPSYAGRIHRRRHLERVYRGREGVLNVGPSTGQFQSFAAAQRRREKERKACGSASRVGPMQRGTVCSQHAINAAWKRRRERQVQPWPGTKIHPSPSGSIRWAPARSVIRFKEVLDLFRRDGRTGPLTVFAGLSYGVP